MANYSCELIRDLLPLYVDGVCSEESKAAVEAHLEICDACKAEYQRLLDGEKLVPTPKPDADKAEGKQIKALRRLKRSLHKKRLAAVLLTTVTVTGIAIGLFMLINATFVIIPYDKTKMQIEEMTPENAEKAQLAENETRGNWVDFQVSEEITEYYAFLTAKYVPLEEDGKTIHAKYYYLASSLSDYLAHGGRGSFREHRLQRGWNDSFPDGKMHWALSTVSTQPDFSEEPVEPGFADGYKVTVEAPVKPDHPYIVTKEIPLDRIYYISGPHFSFEFSDDQKIIEQHGVLIWEREE